MQYFNRPNLKRWAMVAFSGLTMIAILQSIHIGPAAAQSPIPHFFTTTPTADGVVVVDQSTGFITFCTSYVQKKPNLAGVPSALPAGQCAPIGKIAASPAAVPNFMPNLTVIPQSPNLYVINNVTGQIVQCSIVNTIVEGVSTAVGSCVAQGLAAQ